MSSTVHARRAVALFAAVALLASVLVAASRVAQAQSAQEQPLDNLQRVDAGSFVDAGVQISQRLFGQDGAAAAVLATDANYPDALGASAVSGKVGGPVLFSPSDALAEATRAELGRALPAGATVYFMGGPAALSQQVEDAVTGDGFAVVRLQGATRFETAAAAGNFVGTPDGRVLLARAFGPPNGDPLTDQFTGWVDAIGCGGFAADRQTPILLSDTATLSPSTLEALGNIGATSVTICGGNSAIGPETEAQLREAGFTTDRVFGPTRIETGVEVARTLWGYATPAGRNYIVINGYGPRFGYGLAAAPLSAALDAPILLVGDGEPTACDSSRFASAATFCYVEAAEQNAPASFVVVGDEGQVTREVSTALAEAAGGQRQAAPAPSPTAEPSSSPSPRPSRTPRPDESPSPQPSASPEPEPSPEPSPEPEPDPEPAPPPPPSQVSAVDETNDDGTRVVVRWSGVEGADGYNVFVNDARQGGNPTVGGGTTAFEVTGLEPGTGYEFRVSTVRDGREGGRSNPAAATPADEAPPAPATLDAVPGNSLVDLVWAAVGVPDLRDYTLSRATVADDADDCEGAADGDFAEIFTGDTTTFRDEDAENDTSYCYRIVTNDDADQTSPEPTQTGPVTPSTGAPSVTFVAPSDDDLDPTSQPTFNGTGPLSVTYRVSDINTPLANLRIVVEYSLNDGVSYVPAPLFDGLHGTSERTRTINVTTPDVDSDDVRIRVTAFDEESSADSERSDRLTFTRTPSRVSGLAALAGNEQVALSWLPNPEMAVSGYQIRRAEITGPSDALDPSQCDAAQYTDLAQTEGRLATTFLDSNVDNGGFTDDTLYCYRVFAMRPGDEPDGPPAQDDANPSGVDIDIDVTRPDSGATIPGGTTYQLRFTVARPDGAAAPDLTRLEYCVDFRAVVPLTRPSCQDDDGFKLIGDVNTDAPGSFTFDWNVPRTGQGDDAEGAIRARVNPDGQNATDVVDGIIFR